MPVKRVEILLDLGTYAVLAEHAMTRAIPLPVDIAALLYRQAATMSGWPGQAGQNLEKALLRAILPEMEEMFEDDE